MEKILPYKCMCGGKLKRTFIDIEFFDIDFGVKRAETCTKCGEVYLDQSTLKEVEKEIKKKGLFGLEAKTNLRRSNSKITIEAPEKFLDFMKIEKKMPARIFPLSKNKFEVELT